MCPRRPPWRIVRELEDGLQGGEIARLAENERRLLASFQSA
jgi:hypothetical protein